MKKPLLLAVLALGAASSSWALEFRTTARAAVLYDAPSQHATKVAVAGVGVPFEVFVDTESWTKVRDATGRLAWLEKSALGNARNVMVSVEEARVNQQPLATAELRFRAIRGVLLATRGEPRAGWIEVQHADGMSGWIRQHEVWGE